MRQQPLNLLSNKDPDTVTKMETLFRIALITHIIAGSLALLTGLFAILFRNKIKWHRPCGKVYFWSMNIIFVSATFMSIYHTNLFLLCVSFFTYYSALTAYRWLSLKKLHLDQNPAKLDWAIEIFFGTVHLCFVGYAIFSLLNGHQALGTISLVFGLIGVQSNLSTIKRLRKKLGYKNYWLLAHIGGMLGSYIGAMTAFLVNNGQYIHVPGIVLWLGPTVIFVPLIFYEINVHKKKSKRFDEIK
ncbi:MAG: DUF2306 domain-containing protein [Sphingobacteriaceae bacterium]|nr:DUF2306 domain-containing protein [Sphingobacteriaceae bacterium]